MNSIGESSSEIMTSPFSSPGIPKMYSTPSASRQRRNRSLTFMPTFPLSRSRQTHQQPPSPSQPSFDPIAPSGKPATAIGPLLHRAGNFLGSKWRRVNPDPASSADHELQADLGLEGGAGRVQRDGPRLVADDAVRGDTSPYLEALHRVPRQRSECTVDGARRSPLAGCSIGQYPLETADHGAAGSEFQRRHRPAIGQGIPRERPDDAVGREKVG